jgi:hypothetical protein
METVYIYAGTAMHVVRLTALDLCSFLMIVHFLFMRWKENNIPVLYRHIGLAPLILSAGSSANQRLTLTELLSFAAR